jgi:hypothetical protein
MGYFVSRIQLFTHARPIIGEMPIWLTVCSDIVENVTKRPFSGTPFAIQATLSICTHTRSTGDDQRTVWVTALKEWPPMRCVPHLIICVALIVAMVFVATVREGVLASTAMTALSAALAVAITWFFGARTSR